MIGLALALALTVQEAPTATWAEVRPDGWTYLGQAADRDLLMFRRSALGAGVKAWLRFEYGQDQPTGTRSARTLFEYDCSEGRLRVLQSSSFAEPNMAGQNLFNDSAGPWEYPAPGTFGEMHFAVACPP